MLELFRVETESQAQTLTAGLLALERDAADRQQLETCMRAAHSLKGAARIVGLKAGVSLAHAMEDCFVGAQNNEITLRRECIDALLRAVDLLGRVARMPEAELAQWLGEKSPEIEAAVGVLKQVRDGQVTATPEVAAAVAPEAVTAATGAEEGGDRVLRVTADNLNRLLGLAGESLVESRWLGPFSESLLQLKRRQRAVGRGLQELCSDIPQHSLPVKAWSKLADVQQRASECEQWLAQRLVEIEMFGHRSANLSHRLYGEALACRMRPFADGAHAFPRMVRDLARTLGKEVRFEVVGETTQVDRDILQKLDAPLGHLLRNAVDHGIEAPAERRKAGKPVEGVIRLEARHSAGMLQVSVSDDGRGVDLERLRATVVERKLASAATARDLSQEELLEFLFLPGFTMKTAVTDISGRGVGLDVVQDLLKRLRGTVRVISQPGRGIRFQLQLPLTLSVTRTLLADVGGEPYAFPLAHIARALKVPRERIESLEGRQHFEFDGQRIGLVAARELLGGAAFRAGAECPIIVFGPHGHRYGVMVDRFLGERELVVQPIDERLGKTKDIAAAALMEDGSPVLIVDVDDLLRSVEKLVASGKLDTFAGATSTTHSRKLKRVLVVDDSLTVRELERKLLANRGYKVEIAVDGMDGWNAVRAARFDLVVTDIDMPRMDGIELVSLIKKDPTLKSVPVMIISYKDREEDRRRGLEAGADYYLAKGSFHDETLLQAVTDLIGEAQE